MSEIPNQYSLGDMGMSPQDALYNDQIHKVVAAADQDGDERIDVMAYDRDGDGVSDKFTLDTDADGKADTIALDRDFDSIRKTAMAGLDPLADRDAFLTRMEQFAAQGIELITMQPLGPDPVGWTAEVLDTVAPAVRDL